MEKKPSYSSERFQDPLGDYMNEALASKKQILQQEDFPVVEESYKGFYAGFEPLGKEGTVFLSSSEGIVGTELVLRQTAGSLGFFARENRCIATLEKELSRELNSLLSEGWTIHCILAYIMFVADEKTFSAQFACFCYSPGLTDEHKKTLENFIHNMVDRIASASHPSLKLTQEQFARVLQSKGEWFFAKDEPWPELPRGSIYYRRRRTFNDRLIGAALKGNRGCIIATWIAMIMIVAAIALLVWFKFFSG